MKAARLVIATGRGDRDVALADYLEPADEEQATVDAGRWIKDLRQLNVDGEPLRRRFTVRGDSLWWFTELFLHKQQVVLGIFRILAALHRLEQEERPHALAVATGGRVLRQVVGAFAASRGMRSDRGSGAAFSVARMNARARALMLAASASRLRGATGNRTSRAQVAVFAHRAFWRAGVGDGGGESYIGPVLSALERRLGTESIRYVGVGPPANFQARRWWHPLVSRGASDGLVPIESFAPLRMLAESRRVWRERNAHCRALWGSPDIRQHAVIAGCDCWPLIREELAGVALLQWPWSVRAMDEAAAALDALQPSTVVTYAEAGGWGRALVLEARRRRIPSAGLQHGFIYRHWLNYLHEQDEMEPDPSRPSDAGFPKPTLTLLFDAYAAAHLEGSGHFPPDAIRVTGSPRLDALVASVTSADPGGLEQIRTAAGATAAQQLVLVVTKAREALHVLPALADAAARIGGLHLAIKTHPAETPASYAALASGRPFIRVLPADAPLAPLLRAAQAVVTVNSTVALDAAVLGVPALVIGLPNNLSPFVDAGAMAGASTLSGIEPALRGILYDEQFRLQLERDRRAFLARFAIGSDGRAAERSADAIVDLMARRDRNLGKGD